ncbi:CDP-alcohol phosphatidyltransferase family protein [Pseudarthrobacter sp. S9]|uniref:CDP-alcohol phosphatidyltransferase family protein n=1 Tax=Pseudarthrobacter sp. S9 TaxID=3418421 RepID=UPI003D06169F
MQSTMARRAVIDVAAALAAFLGVGIWLGATIIPDAGLRYVAIAAGAAVIGRAAVSILRREPRFSTPADRVTLLRAVLVACCATVTVGGLLEGPIPTGLVVLLGTGAFLLDAVDGRVARLTGTASAEGSLLDTDTDGALVLALSCATAGTVGPWTLGIGLMYYLFLAVGRFRPSLKARLPSSTARKVIGAIQPSALLFALAPGVPPVLGTVALGLALPLLVFSFGRDTVELERRHRSLSRDQPARTGQAAARGSW